MTIQADIKIHETPNFVVIEDQVALDYDGNTETVYFLDEKYDGNGLKNLTSSTDRAEIIKLADAMQALAA